MGIHSITSDRYGPTSSLRPPLISSAWQARRISVRQRYQFKVVTEATAQSHTCFVVSSRASKTLLNSAFVVSGCS